MKILVAEDDNTTMSIIRFMLDKWGYEHLSASDGNEAWKIMQAENPPQLLLLDWMMPGIDGVELCRKIKKQIIDRPVYVIMLTSKSDRDDIVKGLEAGADDYVPKPPDRLMIKARIDVGLRSLAMQNRVHEYASNMEKLARERAEQLVHADRMSTLGILSAGIGHEINNPLFFISLNIKVIEDCWNDVDSCLRECSAAFKNDSVLMMSEEMPSIIGDMKSGVSRIQSIVDGLKTYSHIDSEDRMSPVSIKECISESLFLCKSHLKNRVKVELALPEEDLSVRCNMARLEQVLVNLFINAADAMENITSDAVISIGLEKNGNRIAVKVRDSGYGIPDHAIDKIFEPFFTTKDVGKGTGLGLSISSSIVQSIGGSMTASNVPEGGAEFVIDLPVCN